MSRAAVRALAGYSPTPLPDDETPLAVSDAAEMEWAAAMDAYLAGALPYDAVLRAQDTADAAWDLLTRPPQAMDLRQAMPESEGR